MTTHMHDMLKPAQSANDTQSHEPDMPEVPDTEPFAAHMSDSRLSPYDIPLSAPAPPHLQGILMKNAGTIVHGLAFSSDGALIALGGRDNQVQVWDVSNGQEIERLTGHTHYITSVAFSPDGNTLASGSRDKTVRVWTLNSDRESRRLDGHTGRITTVTFSPDGTLLASCGEDKTIRLWNVVQTRQIRRIEAHTRTVTNIAFSPDGTLLASASEDKTIRLWEMPSGREVKRLERHRDSVRSVAFSSDGRVLASASDDKSVCVWDIASGRVIRQLEGHIRGVETVAFSGKKNILVTGSRDKTVRLYEVIEEQLGSFPLLNNGDTGFSWTIANEQEIVRLSGPKDYIRSIVYSTDGSLFGIITDAYTVRICGIDMPEGSWERLEYSWHEMYTRWLQRRHAAGRCEECGARLNIWEKISRIRLCKQCR